MIGRATRMTAVVVVAWWALAEGAAPEGAGWLPAAAAVVATVVTGVVMRLPGGRVPRLARVPRFVVFFVGQSVLGGIDVAWRVLAPRGEVAPGVTDFECRLADGTPRALFLALVSVMPGTLVAEEGDGADVRVHVIDRRVPVRGSLERVEAEIDALLGARS